MKTRTQLIFLAFGISENNQPPNEIDFYLYCEKLAIILVSKNGQAK